MSAVDHHGKDVGHFLKVEKRHLTLPVSPLVWFFDLLLGQRDNMKKICTKSY